jgi:hypothetical protein
MKILGLILIASLFNIIIANAQNEFDALKFSNENLQGTARSLAMGNAFGGLGGDMSAISINPAGIGIYRKFEIAFSSGFMSENAKSKYFNNNTRNFLNKYTFNNIGFIGCAKTNDESGWKSANFAFIYNRKLDFNHNISIAGLSDSLSMVDYFFNNVYNKNGDRIPPEDLDSYFERLAFDAYIIDTISGDPNSYVSPVPMNGLYQRKTINSKGSGGDYIFAFGANYNDKLYLGLSFKISKFKFETNDNFKEEDYLNNSNNFDYYTFNYWNYSKGSGYTLNLGIIARPVDFFRLGLSYQFPTFYNINDKFNTYMTSNYVDEKIKPTDKNGNYIGENEYDYYITTPSKVNISTALLFGKIGLISADIETIDYSHMQMQSSGYDTYDFYNENQNIQKIFKRVYNLRIGAETRIGPISLRGGYSYYPSPYVSSEINRIANKYNISSGIGYRNNNFFFDIAYIYSIYNEYYYLYNTYNAQPAKINLNNSRLITTIGFRF